MKRIGIIAFFYGWLPGEKGPTRFSFIAEMLAKKGYSVDLIGSSFHHHKKEHRNTEQLKREHHPYNLVFIDEPGYKKNIELKRIYSYHIATKNLKKYLQDKDYDIIYCAIPPNSIAKTAAKYANKKNIPFVVDIEDIWPEAWRIKLGNNIFMRIATGNILNDAKETYKLVDGVIGTSDEYTSRAFKDNKKKNIPHETAYVCIDLPTFDGGVKQFFQDIKKEEDEFWITYAGTLGSSYDIKTLILANQILVEKGYDNIKVKILGTGPMKDEWEMLSRSIECKVEFLGYVPYAKMAAYLTCSDIVINSCVKKSLQSIVTKIGDYLASGKPMINTCSSIELKNKIAHDKCGINVEAEDPQLLAKSILTLYENDEIRREYGKNARNIAETQFDRNVEYLKITNMIEGLISSNERK